MNVLRGVGAESYLLDFQRNSPYRMKDDRKRWEERYAVGDWVPVEEPAWVVEHARPFLRPPGLAWDAASGPGRHSLLLARLGFRVLATDISWAALRRLRERARAEGLPVFPVHADLNVWRPRPAPQFEVVLDTYFLLRPLFPVFRESLKPRGLLIVETYNVDEIDVLGGDIRRAHALEHGELVESFRGFEVLHYEEGVLMTDEGERGLTRMIARKPG